ncbi:hypothetical protein [Ammoniphilus sp. 3BR4]|uniref:hypothetical protein n=1 Tax=Ammoniphilus sp. 3BR4 TaxID=3158265 RepID=UPI0034657CDE
MFKIFIEYKISEKGIHEYLKTMKAVRERMINEQSVVNYQHFEGTDQPLLFVEMFDVETLEEYERLKHLRCEKDPMIADWVQGGKDKIHMWAFKELE